MTKPWTIAIDGPAGAGKSTVARLLAARLDYTYVDSGAMYRSVAFLARENGIPTNDEDAVAALARSARIAFAPGENGEPQRVLLNGDEVSGVIRTPEIATLASVVSTIPGVRAALVAQQKTLGAQGGVVMEGRDIGTVVFPQAEVKIFLTASATERAARRFRDITTSSETATLESVRADQDERDRRDATRMVSPLAPASDAILLESDGHTPEEIVSRILEIMDAKRREV